MIKRKERERFFYSTVCYLFFLCLKLFSIHLVFGSLTRVHFQVFHSVSYVCFCVEPLHKSTIIISLCFFYSPIINKLSRPWYKCFCVRVTCLLGWKRPLWFKAATVRCILYLVGQRKFKDIVFFPSNFFTLWLLSVTSTKFFLKITQITH